MRIYEFRLENFKRVKLVEIHFPESGTIEICGPNESGKTSVLDGIFAILVGADASPELPIRRDATSANGFLDLGDITVERRWDASGTKLLVKNASGVKQGSAQTLLDGLLSRLAFNPIAFMHEKPEQQAETLRQIAGLDFRGIDGDRETVYRQRTDVNKILKQREAIFRSLTSVEPATAVSLTDLSRRLVEINAQNHQAHQTQFAIERQAGMVEVTERTLVSAKAEVASHAEDALGLVSEYEALQKSVPKRMDVAPIEAEIARLQRQLEQAKNHNRDVERAERALVAKGIELESAETAGERLATNVAVARESLEKATVNLEALRSRQVQIVDTAPLMEQIADAERHNSQAAEYAKFAAAKTAMAEASRESQSLTRQIDELDREKNRLLSEAKFPVAGLSLQGDTVTFNGVPFSQASSAQQIRILLAIAAALNPDLKLILVRDGSLLDRDNLRLIATWATENGYQVLLERVADSAVGAGVLLEEGLVASVHEAVSSGAGD